MGKISILTKEQRILLDGLKGDPFIAKTFYFTGGTALSEYYLHHRYSEDIDLFSETPFDTQFVFSAMSSLQKTYGFSYRSEHVATVYMFYIEFPQKPMFKIDFNHYAYKRLEPGTLSDGLSIDSLLDIAVNKLLTVTQRNDVKDFVDVFFLEPKFGMWDLIQGVKVKFHIEVEPWLLATDLLKVEDFTALPKMIAPLSLITLKQFFRQKAKALAKKSVA